MTINELRRLPLFAEATDQALEELLCHAPNRQRHYRSGDIVALQGSKARELLILISGSVRAEMNSPEGKRLVIDEIDAPSLLASAFVYSSEGKMPVTVEAKEASVIWAIDREYWLGFMGRNIVVMRAFLRDISDRTRFLSQKLKALSLQSLRERILTHLETHGSIGKQEDLALRLGVARPSLSRLLSELSDEGLIVKDSQGYRLPTHDKKA